MPPIRRLSVLTCVLLSALWSPSAPVLAQGDPVCDPSAAVEPCLAFLAEEGNMPGLGAAVVKEGHVVWVGGVGWAEIGERPVDADTLFLTASVSKPVTATLVSVLAEGGALGPNGLDADVRPLLPFSVDNPVGADQPITFRQLLGQTGTVQDTSKILGTFTYGEPAGDLGPFLQSYLQSGGALYAPSNFVDQPPGTTFAYSNVGTSLAGYAAERATGVPFEELAEQVLFAPLGMTDATFDLLDAPAERLARSYRWNGRNHTFAFSAAPDVPYRPAVTLRASARDLARFLVLHTSGGTTPSGVLSPAGVAEMAEVHNRQASTLQLLGFRRVAFARRNMVGTWGDGTGVGAFVGYQESSGIGIVVATNVMIDQAGAGDALERVFERLFAEAQAFEPPDEPEEPEEPVDPPGTPEDTSRRFFVESVLAGGRGGEARFRSDLTLHHPGDVGDVGDPAARVTLTFLARGLPSAEPPTAELMLEPGATRVVEDVLALFGLDEGQGALEIEVTAVGAVGDQATAPRVTGFSRSVRVDGGDAFGQLVPWIDPDTITGETASIPVPGGILGAEGASRWIPTLGLVSLADGTAVVLLDLLDADGVSVAQADLTLAAGAARSRRLDQLFPALTDPATASELGAGGWTVRVATGPPADVGTPIPLPRPVAVSMTLLESATGDQIFLPAQTHTTDASPRYVPRAVRGEGQRGIQLQTPVVAASTADAVTLVDLGLLERGQDNSDPVTVNLPLQPGQVVSTLDVLRDEFGIGDDRAAGLRVETGAADGATVPVVGALVLATGETGRFGTRVPVLGAADAGRRLVAPGAGQGEALSTAYGLLSLSAGTTRVELTVRDADGVELGSRVVGLQPFQHLERLLIGLLPDLALTDGTGWSVETEVLAGEPVLSYLANLDPSGDVYFVPAVPLDD